MVLFKGGPMSIYIIGIFKFVLDLSFARLGIRFFKRVSVLLWVRRLCFLLAGGVSILLLLSSPIL